MIGNPPYLFAYGTLRRGGHAPLNRLLHAKAPRVGIARARGALYRIGWYPGFVPDRHGRVTGDLLDIGLRSALLALLDRYEECTPDFPAPHEYRRQRIRVQAGGRMVDAWTYVYARPVNARRRIRTGDFLR